MKKIATKRNVFILLGLLALLGIIIYINHKKKSKELAAKRKLIEDAIETGVGESGTDAGSTLIGVTPTDYAGAIDDARKLCGAIGGWLSEDKDEVVWETLSGKTKAQLAKLNELLPGECNGYDLDAFLKDIFGELQDRVQGKYERAIEIINNAK